MDINLLKQTAELIKKLPTEQQAEQYEKLVANVIEAMQERKKVGRPKKEKIEKEEKSETKLQTIHKDIDWEECLKIIKEENSWVIDWTKDEQINYSTLLVRKLKETKRVEEWYQRQDIVRTIIETVKWDTYYWWRCANPKKLYFNLWTLIKRCEKIWNNNQVLTVI